jgi:heterodisulfide reductase subunit C
MAKSKQNNEENTKAQTAQKAKGQAEKPQAAKKPPIAAVGQLDLRFRDEIAGHPGGENIRRCFACGTCAAGCPVTEVDSEYNCRRIIRQILLGMREEVLSSPLIWQCLICYRCYVRCPQKVNFTDMAVKEKRVSPETFEQINELDRFSQVVRHDLVKAFFNKDGLLLGELESRIGNVMKEARAQ